MSYGFAVNGASGRLPQSYAEAAAIYAEKSKRSNWTGRVAHNTYLHERCDGFVVRLHLTDVVFFHPDGRVTLSTDGWQTFLTRERIRRCGFRCGSSNGVVSVLHLGRWWTFADGMTLNPDGTVEYDRDVDPDPVRVEKRRVSARRKANRTGDFSDFTHCDTRGSSRWHGGNVPEAFIAPPASSPALEVA